MDDGDEHHDACVDDVGVDYLPEHETIPKKRTSFLMVREQNLDKVKEKDYVDFLEA